ncbi:hypothetical protein RDI58_006245 [Solanum bulbocastanum]|uniref:Uncharacterized protein n=1 Tax=Solanum bulbocastanum TaxID=147425 RepID=A0AAN8UAK1_SOLBU
MTKFCRVIFSQRPTKVSALRSISIYNSKSGRRQVFGTLQKEHEQELKGVVIQLLYCPVFYFFSSLQTTIFDGIIPPTMSRLAFQPSIKYHRCGPFCCSPSDVPVKDFCKMRSQTKL